MNKIRHWLAAMCCTLFVPALVFAGEDPVLLLEKQEPSLFRLYQSYSNQLPELDRYVFRQGFTAPFERLAARVHELIHIDSFEHQGFYVDGIYYEPYLKREAWPVLDNGDIQGELPAEGPVFNAYVRRNPKNHLGNVLDEINAYTQVLPFVCLNEPASAAKQITNLTAFLVVEEVYLHKLHESALAEYTEFENNKASRGALLLITQRAYTALDRCGVTGRYPRLERDRFASGKDGF